MSLARIIFALGAVLFLGLAINGRGAAADPKPAPKPFVPIVKRLIIDNWWLTNCYFIVGKKGEAILIDPGDDQEMIDQDKDLYRLLDTQAPIIENILKENKWKLKLIILTHGHIDHIGGIRYLKKKTGAKILMHAADIKNGCPKDTRMFEGGLPKVDRVVKDGEVIKLDGITLKVIHAPGHSPGSICLFTEIDGKPVLFSGDVLLYHSVGRTNFRDGSGDGDLLLKSIKEKLFALPDETLVLPGHYDFTTIGEEKARNPFVKPVPPVEPPPADPKPPVAPPANPPG